MEYRKTTQCRCCEQYMVDKEIDQETYDILKMSTCHDEISPGHLVEKDLCTDCFNAEE